MFFDLDTRVLLRTRPNPLTTAESAGSAPPAGRIPTPTIDRTGRVQRRASGTGTVMVAGQNIALGRVHAGKTVTIDVTDTSLAVECDDGVRTIRRTNQHRIRNIKANRPAPPNRQDDRHEPAT